ncbi:hypothetical protein R1sor_011136 [Riccia sorocarpa]|uniref:MBD domain-containing protein n=1 Tax=Riccia sorocarpa TaxID=122646 RepID=A0ABD3I3N4_9MARC
MVAKEQNLLSQKSGEGPPIAPKGWKWRCGKRPKDMYFTAPDGSQYRSKRSLNEYLKTLDNPPAPTDFCWAITPQVLDDPALQEFKPTPSPKKTSSTLKPKKAKTLEKPVAGTRTRKSRK